jgi:endonuclease YncB( thermonuclease family)
MVAATLLAAAVDPARSATIIEAASVTLIDGDTLDVGAVRVRIHGIDAPEAGQRCADGRGGVWSCGEQAVQRMAELVEGGRIACEGLGEDPFGRVLAICEVRGVDVGARLIEEGLAWAFRRYSADYAHLEVMARRARRGVWRADTDPPWVYRDQRWKGAADQAPRRGCPIKGNITGKGEKIYHVPWSPWYDRTGVDEARGERWFCDEAEAAAAGWRAARWR